MGRCRDPGRRIRLARRLTAGAAKKKAGLGPAFFVEQNAYFLVSVVTVADLLVSTVPLGVVVDTPPETVEDVVDEVVELAGGAVGASAGLVTSTLVVLDDEAGGAVFTLVSQATRPTARTAASRYDGFIVRIPSVEWIRGR